MQQHYPLLREAALEAGASPEFVTVAAFDESTIGVGRNSTREEAMKQITTLGNVVVDGTAEAVEEAAEALRANHKLGGSFYSHLWDGDLVEAVFRADGHNARILTHLFPEEYVLARAVASGRYSEGNLRALQETFDRHG